jgi:hypothetical protein
MYTLRFWEHEHSHPEGVTRGPITYSEAYALIDPAHYKTQIISSLGVVEFEIKHPV